MNFFYPDDNSVFISTDEITTLKEINLIAEIFAKAAGKVIPQVNSYCDCKCIDEKFLRKSDFLQGRNF